MKSIYRYTVPIDDEWHGLDICEDPVAVACADDFSYVEFWAEHKDGCGSLRRFRIFGTGHPIPDFAVYRGTASRVMGLVFHLYEER